MSLRPLERLGAGALRLTLRLGHFSVFALQVVATYRRRPLRLRRHLDALYDVGVLSLVIVGLSGTAVGLVLGLQGYNTLVRFGAEDSLGAVVGLSLIRELGPVLTALLVAGRAGSAVAAEIAAMVATEQVDGLRMMAIDPLDFVVAPKFLAMVIAMPLLSALFIVLGLFGAHLVGVTFLGLDAGGFLTSLESSVQFSTDILGSFVKALVFGLLAALIATYRGLTAPRHSAGVSLAATSSVVITSVAVLISDYFITALWGV